MEHLKFKKGNVLYKKKSTKNGYSLTHQNINTNILDKDDKIWHSCLSEIEHKLLFVIVKKFLLVVLIISIFCALIIPIIYK